MSMQAMVGGRYGIVTSPASYWCLACAIQHQASATSAPNSLMDQKNTNGCQHGIIPKAIPCQHPTSAISAPVNATSAPSRCHLSAGHATSAPGTCQFDAVQCHVSAQRVPPQRRPMPCQSPSRASPAPATAKSAASTCQLSGPILPPRCHPGPASPAQRPAQQAPCGGAAIWQEPS